MDVTPRTGPGTADGTPAPTAGGGRRRGLAIGVVLVAALAAVGFLLIKQIDSASLYYYNADEAFAKRDDLGDQRFRIQGTVVDRRSAPGDDRLTFTIAFAGARVEVDHDGVEPSALFEEGMPVVCEGRWSPDGARFVSDRIEVKHSSEYKAENPDRLDPAAP